MGRIREAGAVRHSERPPMLFRVTADVALTADSIDGLVVAGSSDAEEVGSGVEVDG